MARLFGMVTPVHSKHRERQSITGSALHIRFMAALGVLISAYSS